MSDLTQDALKLFDLGSLLAELRFRAEVAWFWGADEEMVSKVGGVTAKIVKTIQNTDFDYLSPEADAALLQIQESVSTYWTSYSPAWEDPARTTLLKELNEADVDGVSDVSALVLDAYPLPAGIGPELHNLLKPFRCGQGKVEPWLMLGFLLASEWAYPSYTGGQLGGEAKDVKARLVEVDDQIQAQLTRASRHFPFVAGFRCSVSDLSSRDASNAIARLAKDLIACLKDPHLKPGYLGLVLDRPHSRIRRGDWTAKLGAGSELQWTVLGILVKNADALSSRSRLDTAWHDTEPQDASSLDQVLYQLRQPLREVRVKLENERGTGWRLVEMKESGRQRKMRP